MTTITIIGAGMMGTALCWPLADNHHQIRLVGTPLDEDIIASLLNTGEHPRLQQVVPLGVVPYPHTKLAQAVQGADLVVSGVSSFGVHWFATEAGKFLSPSVPVISVTKGLFDQPDGLLLTVPEMTNAWFPVELQGITSLNAIGGPCIAQELAARRHTGTIFCGQNPDALNWIASLFQTDYYHVRTSTDVTGVEVCAALKNPYALGINLVIGEHEDLDDDGLARRFNPQAALFAQSLTEMRLIVKRLGGDTHQVYGLPGAGDLYVTVFAGRTARLGKLLGKGIPYPEARQMLAGETLETVEIISNTARATDAWLQTEKQTGRIFPCCATWRTLLQGTAKAIPWDKFFR